MKIQLGLTLLSISLITIYSCSGTIKSSKSAVGLTSQTGRLVNNGQAWAAAWQQNSGEYKALCFQAFFLAKMRLDQLLAAGTAKPPAIVTDIDETVLDNSPYTVHQSLQNKGYSEETWVEWTDKAIADTVPGALAFLNYAKSRGVTVFYVTNRIEKERSSTLKNLQHWGFPDADTDHLLLKKETSGKEPRRMQVSVSNEIVLLMGDNLSDFSPVFDKQQTEARNARVVANAEKFGSRFIVLPNSMYGDWEAGYYKFNYNLSNSGKDSAVRATLKNY
ncbi:MAG: 5'-nucleotidase, lipoprotein e(P4) family [Chitinophagaceae bacterium]|nr:MAG: 5'-nucleotidase, lipoprotein e(P4) family [Chitinophagaceae bacterium]